MKMSLVILCLLMSGVVNANSGFFVKGAIGKGGARQNLKSDKDTAIGLSIGYEINPTLQAQFGVKEFGTYNQGLYLEEYYGDGYIFTNAFEQENSANASFASLAFNFPLDNHYFIQAELGFFNWQQNIDFYRVSNYYVNDDYFDEVEDIVDSGTDAFWGIGVLYAMDKVDVAIKFNRWEMNRFKISESELSLAYHF